MDKTLIECPDCEGKFKAEEVKRCYLCAKKKIKRDKWRIRRENKKV